MGRIYRCARSLPVALAAILVPVCLVAAEPSPLLAAAKQELARSMDALGRQEQPPYFLSYEITDARTVTANALFGSLAGSQDATRRQIDIDLRVGSNELDNTHQIRGSRSSRSSRYAYIAAPLADDQAALRAALWYHTDKTYKQAVEQLQRVKTNVQVKVEEEDRSFDFSAQKPERFIGDPAELIVDRSVWESRVKRYTEPFARFGEIFQAQAGFAAVAKNRLFVNSEGTELQTSSVEYRLYVSAYTKADDGMELPRFESFAAFSPDGLPDDEAVLATVERMIADLLRLREAPVVDPYTGPAILSGRAAGVFFHEVFGHRIEGHRQKREEEGQTFKKMVGKPLLPSTFSVYFDPTLRRAADHDLTGYFLYDNEGVKARRVPVIEKGVFKNFLMSRSPIDGFPVSNGHGRRQAGFSAVARQSNLVVDVSETVSRAELKARLLDLVEKDGKPFGLIFEDVQGGFTMTGRTIANAFNVLPVMVYRVFPDGKEELVRGVDLIGTPLTAFSDIAVADDRPEVFNGTCGAESGGVPVSAVSPGILITQIEVQKKEKSQERAPILAAPLPAAGTTGDAP